MNQRCITSKCSKRFSTWTCIDESDVFLEIKIMIPNCSVRHVVQSFEQFDFDAVAYI